MKNFEDSLKKSGEALPKKATSLSFPGYWHELDVTQKLNQVMAMYYQSHIGILRWVVELGCIDITCEISLMTSCMVLLRADHLSQLYHCFAHLQDTYNTELVFDPAETEIDEASFVVKDWKDTVYGMCFEEMPTNTPKCRGVGFKIVAYVDVDHTDDSVTRRSRTGFIVYLNSAQTYWSSKKQDSNKTSSFASEFVAMKLCCEYLCGLRYKLRMMRIPCEFRAICHHLCLVTTNQC